MVGDRIADMLTRIRNANQMRYETVEVLGSKMTLGIAEIFSAVRRMDLPSTIIVLPSTLMSWLKMP